MGSINGWGNEDKYINSLGKKIYDKYLTDKRERIESEYIPLGPRSDLPAPRPETRLIQPVTHENLEYRDGDILQRYDLGEKIANTENGGQGTVYRARRKTDGRDTVVKVYVAAETGDWDEILNEEKRAGREIRFLERANREGIPGVPRIVQYGVTGSFIKTPVSVFDFIPGKSLEEEVLDKNYSPSLESVLGLFSGLFPALEYAHHSNGIRPVVHRDINPGNIKVNGHPVLMDWASSTPTSGKTQLRTQMFTEYFTAPEVVEGKAFDGRADIYSLGKVFEFMLLGHVFRDADGEPGSEDFKSLNVPADIVRILGKATEKDPGKRYPNIREFYDDFQRAYGMTIPKIPARSETEKPKEVAKGGDTDLPKIVASSTRDKETALDIIYNGMKMQFDIKGKTLYDIARKLRKEARSRIEHLDRDSDWPTEPARISQISSQFAVAYLKSTVKKDNPFLDLVTGNSPVLRYMLTQNRTLENTVNEIMEIEDPTERYKGILALGDVIGYDEADSLDTYRSWIGHPFKPNPNFHDFEESESIFSKFLVGFPILCSIKYYKKLRAKSAIRKIDSWIEEAKRTQNPSALEGKVGESVELTVDEKNKIKKNSIDSAAISIPDYMLGSAFLGLFVNPYLALSFFGTPFVAMGNYLISQKILTKRKLKQKRLAAGLDEDGMREIQRFAITEEDSINHYGFKRDLSGIGLKKKFLRKKFMNSGVKVEYSEVCTNDDFKGTFYRIVTIKCKPGEEEIAQPVIELLKPLNLPNAKRLREYRIISGASGSS